MAERHQKLTNQPNSIDENWYNGCFERYVNPVVTAEHIPLEWRYDLDPATNPFGMERLGINAVMNSGAIEFNGKICLVCRVEGYDRKSFFAVAESENGIDNFKFKRYPVLIDQTDDPDTNVYDMRLTRHEDGWIYGLFCTERKDPDAPAGDTSSAVALAVSSEQKILKTGSVSPTLSLRARSSATSYCIRNSSTVSTPSTPVRRMALSMRAQAAASHGDSAKPSKTPDSKTKRSLTASCIILSRRSKTAVELLQ